MEIEQDRYFDLAAKAFTAYFNECQKLKNGDLIPVEFEDLPYEFSQGWIEAVKEVERVLNETTSDNQ